MSFQVVEFRSSIVWCVVALNAWQPNLSPARYTRKRRKEVLGLPLGAPESTEEKHDPIDAAAAQMKAVHEKQAGS